MSTVSCIGQYLWSYEATVVIASPSCWEGHAQNSQAPSMQAQSRIAHKARTIWIWHPASEVIPLQEASLNSSKPTHLSISPLLRFGVFVSMLSRNRRPDLGYPPASTKRD